MKASTLIEKLKSIAVPFDAELTDSEFGPFVKNLIGMKHSAPFIVLSFGEGAGIKTAEAIEILEQLAAEAPFDPIVTNARMGDNPQELQRVYHEPPVTILDFDVMGD